MFGRIRRGVTGASIAVTMVALAIALYIGATILPSALGGWYAATLPGGALHNMSDSFIMLWNLTPVAVVLTIVVAIVAIALYELSKIG
jgi:hypothetical protein